MAAELLHGLQHQGVGHCDRILGRLDQVPAGPPLDRLLSIRGVLGHIAPQLQSRVLVVEPGILFAGGDLESPHAACRDRASKHADDDEPKVLTRRLLPSSVGGEGG